jgi:hypothetical protein
MWRDRFDVGPIPTFVNAPQRTSTERGFPDGHKRKRYCCSRDALLVRQSRMQLGAGHDLEIRPAIVAIVSVNDTRTT